MKTGLDLVATMRWLTSPNTNPGVHYGSYDCNDRCHPDIGNHCGDCSGGTSRALELNGAGHGCEGSFAQARRFHDAGTGLSLADALWTPGAFGFVGINEGQGGIPGRDPGHVFMFEGDGLHSLEFRGHEAGVGRFFATSHVVSWCGFPPGIKRTGQVSQPDDTEPMAPNLAKIRRLSSMICLPNTKDTPGGRQGSARVVPEYNFVLLEDGARLSGDVNVDKTGVRKDRHWWAPPQNVAVPGMQIVDIGDLRVVKEHPQQALSVRYAYPNGDSGPYVALFA